MGIKFKHLNCLWLLLAASVTFPSVAAADMETPNIPTTNSTFEKAYFGNDRNYYENGSVKRQIDAQFGPGTAFENSFTDNEIARDGELLNTLYRDVLAQQATNDPYLRTPDLPNPYNSSLLMSPRYSADRLKVGTEFHFETVPSP
jgi:hypothetical protein